ncbi:hypothetical protein BKP64_09850 [Marinobacter salinus]|uniref:Uncharacterized protein n=1 Tax=Marinobacter salinus TaxID=1874317 RepID=A0A1D9GLC6_9GAMM|nr:DUF6544 family protein [Marinobacter salinus]AOY88443.1 hypothetical protein BKP64_09850 [Marinobacter salinus]
MKILLLIALIIVLGLAALLWIWRKLDCRSDRTAMNRLLATQPRAPERFDPAMVASLPEPARRYFSYVIELGTPLYTVADIAMEGRFGMGNRDKPDYLRMTARQVLAMPTGFVWKMNAGKGLMRLSGSDSERWTRFWLMGFIPVARMGNDNDHARSAFGRYVAEAVFWTPAAVLPGPRVRWELVDINTARVTVRSNGFEQSADITVAEDGQPRQVRFDRWSNANPDKIHRLQPFGGFLSEFRTFSGFRLPTHVEAGNFFGMEDYFPFFIARVTDVTFPRNDS